MLSVVTMSHPQSYEILIVPAFTDGRPVVEQETAADAPESGGSGGGAVAEDAGTKGSDGAAEGTARPDGSEASDGPARAGLPGASGHDSGTPTGATLVSGGDAGNLGPGPAIRSAVVTATGETGESGYPRYAGDGMVADIDPATHTVEALLVDGAELDYGLSVRLSERSVGG